MIPVSTTSTDDVPVHGNDAGERLRTLLDRLEMWGQRLGLERIRAVLAKLGDPQLAAPVVLVAGTNGKGSTATFLSAILRAGGSRVGLYTSPHLESVEERIRIGGRAIATERLVALLGRVLHDLEGGGELPTYFEALTAAGFLGFRDAAVDAMVVEVGLGGRLDATNASEPSLSVITSIGLDHQEHLGSRLAQIAREKAGILRPARPALATAVGSRTVRAALERAAAVVGSDLRFVEDDTSWEAFGAEADGDWWRFAVRTPEDRYTLRSRLRGEHQAVNLAIAVRAAEILRERGITRADRTAIERGVEEARWPGRLEGVRLPDGRRILLDGAHNPSGVAALVRYVEIVPAPGGRDLLFGSLEGKHAERTLRSLRARCERITLTEPPSPKALPAERLLVAAPAATVRTHVEDALAFALEQARDRELLVCGSLYLVGAVRGLLHARFGVPQAAVEVSTG